MPKFSDKENSFIPKSYEELYLHYVVGRSGESLTKSLVRHFIPYLAEDEQEALTHDVFVRCMEKDVISIHDPSKANFGGVIFFVTRTVCLNFLDRRTRNPVTGLSKGTIDTTKVELDFEPGVLKLDLLFNKPPDMSEARIDRERFLRKLFDWAKDLELKAMNKRDKNIYNLLGLMMEQVEPKECAPLLGVTPSTIHNWMSFIRIHALKMREEIGIYSYGVQT